MGREGQNILAKTAFLIVVAACIVSVAWTGGADTSPPDETDRITEPLSGTAWNLVEFRADNGSVVAPPLHGKAPLIAFGESGTLTGSAGCNLYSASYRINGSTIAVEPVVATAATPRMSRNSSGRRTATGNSSWRPPPTGSRTTG